MLTLEKEIEKVVELRDTEKKTFEQIGKSLNFSEKTARRRYSMAQEDSDAFVLDKNDRPPEIKPESDFVPNGKKVPSRFKPLVVTGDCILSADYHVPLHNPSLINSLVTCGKKNNIKKLVIAGDFWHMEDFSSFIPHQPEADWKTERYDGTLIMKTLLRTFDEITLTWGNHDFRLARAAGYKESFSACMKWAFNGLTKDEMKRLRISDLDYMFYKCQHTNRTFRVCHPKNFSKVPLSVPRDLAIKYNTGVISAHSHHCSMGVAPNGRDLIMELGGLFDKTRTEYIQKTDTSHEWTPGYIMFKDGIPNVISPIFGNDLQYRKEEK